MVTIYQQFKKKQNNMLVDFFDTAGELGLHFKSGHVYFEPSYEAIREKIPEKGPHKLKIVT